MRFLTTSNNQLQRKNQFRYKSAKLQNTTILRGQTRICALARSIICTHNGSRLKLCIENHNAHTRRERGCLHYGFRIGH